MRRFIRDVLLGAMLALMFSIGIALAPYVFVTQAQARNMIVNNGNH